MEGKDDEEKEKEEEDMCRPSFLSHSLFRAFLFLSSLLLVLCYCLIFFVCGSCFLGSEHQKTPFGFCFSREIGIDDDEGKR